jgi:hypothetical protein
VVDGIPCRPYRIGEHAAAISAMLLRRLVVAAVAAALLTVVLPLAVTLVLQGEATSAAEVPAAARWLGSPIAFAILLLAVDVLLVRGPLATAVATLTWAGRADLAEMRAVTGLTRATDRDGARGWLAAHPEAISDTPSVRYWRAHLQVLVGDLDAARATIDGLAADAPEDAALVASLRGQLALAAGAPFDAAGLRRLVEAMPDSDGRAHAAAEAAALIAQARWTCGGDHLATLAWAAPLVGARTRGVLVRSYWVPIGVLVIVTAVVLSFLFPVL